MANLLVPSDRTTPLNAYFALRDNSGLGNVARVRGLSRATATGGGAGAGISGPRLGTGLSSSASASVTLSGVQYGDTLTLGGVTLTAGGTQVSGALDFNVGVRATAIVTVAVSPAAATITFDAGGAAGGPFALTPAGGARTPGSDDYDNTLGTTALIAADILAALNDPLNSFAAVLSAAAGPGADDVTATWLTPGTAANALTVTSDDVSVTVPATFAGGVGTDVTAATSLVAAITDQQNGLGFVLASNGSGTLTVVSLEASVVGGSGNLVTMATSAALRLLLSGTTLTGGVTGAVNLQMVGKL